MSDRAERVLLAALAALVECDVAGADICAAWEKVSRDMGLNPGETICTKCGQRQKGLSDDIAL